MKVVEIHRARAGPWSDIIRGMSKYGARLPTKRGADIARG